MGIYNLSDNTKLAKNVYLSINKEFIWPSLDNDYYDENGSCYALKQHIGILVDGTIVPCCLDSKGDINLGNILEDNLDDIINSPRYQQMIEGFKCSKKIEMLCKKCPIKSGIKNTDSV
ncbi:MAG: SPASM domain-containing protein [Bacilli bacterium]|nr:SPASM domain-containing protein [Bacilli bacterium]